MAPVDDLWQQAVDVLQGNDRGSWTRPSPKLYPHQWSWDAAFIAVGWAHLDPARAIAELQSLFRGQWSTGMVPHIVFDPSVAEGHYEPGPQAWASSGHAPDGVLTSAICQPPIHAIALGRIRQIVEAAGDQAALRSVDAAVVDLYPKLVAWHRWLHTARDPEGTGLITILHPWESGLDNSPRWDAPLAAVDVYAARIASVDHSATNEAWPSATSVRDRRPQLIARPDLDHVTDPAERPSNDDYRRYRYLVQRLVAVDHDQARALADHPFRVADVWFSAILAAADDALADLAELPALRGAPGCTGLTDPEHHAARHRAESEHTRTALDGCWDFDHKRCLDVDRITGSPLACDTIASLAPLLAGTSPNRTAILVERLSSPLLAGHPDLRWPLPPSTSPTDPSFDPRAYWRGPQWPPMTWLVWWALERIGHRRTAERLRIAALDQLRVTGCCEYVEPFTGEGLGSDAQSWTAAVALDWLAQGPTATAPGDEGGFRHR
ncbi:MAG: trehalase family glycosidase [Aquihabitans sp.]